MNAAKARDLAIFAVAAIVLVAAIAGAAQIAEVRKSMTPEKSVGSHFFTTDAPRSAPTKPPATNPFAHQAAPPPTVTQTRAS